jgi:hypothetical protein
MNLYTKVTHEATITILEKHVTQKWATFLHFPKRQSFTKKLIRATPGKLSLYNFRMLMFEL